MNETADLTPAELTVTRVFIQDLGTEQTKVNSKLQDGGVDVGGCRNRKCLPERWWGGWRRLERRGDGVSEPRGVYVRLSLCLLPAVCV